MRSLSNHRLKRPASCVEGTACSVTTTSRSPLARASPASTVWRQPDAGDVQHGQLLAHLAHRTADFRPKTHVLAESVLVTLDGIAIGILLFVIEHVRRAVLGQERHLFSAYYPPCYRFLLCHGSLLARDRYLPRVLPGVLCSLGSSSPERNVSSKCSLQA